jgi:hypothetical protein
VNAKQETIATLRRHKAQAWAARNGKATNRATHSWVSGTRAAPVRIGFGTVDCEISHARQIQNHITAWANRGAE